MDSGLARRIELVAGVVVSDPEVRDGEPVFAGTSVPIRTFIQYRDGHSPLYEFLLDFPEVRSTQAKKFLKWWAEQQKSGVQDIMACLDALRAARA